MRNNTKSRYIIGSIPGRCTLTATVSPLAFNFALYTWPKLAAAIGSGVISSNTSFTGFPNSSSMSANASSLLNAGTSSCNFVSSSMKSARTTSGLFANTCPAFTNAGPKDAKPTLSCSLRSRTFRSPTPLISSYTKDPAKTPADQVISIRRRHVCTVSNGVLNSVFCRMISGEYFGLATEHAPRDESKSSFPPSIATLRD
mmetsp:Transcript_1389/g.4166  ORF Transcript_1389/g.4166 Transcript_1389/m.4166 type:complete len:200 (+) Transcript_1389:1760-2359(+)